MDIQICAGKNNIVYISFIYICQWKNCVDTRRKQPGALWGKSHIFLSSQAKILSNQHIWSRV